MNLCGNKYECFFYTKKRYVHAKGYSKYKNLKKENKYIFFSYECHEFHIIDVPNNI